MGPYLETNNRKSEDVKPPFRPRSLGAAAAGLSDQYSDGKAAKVWQLYIGGPLLTFSLFGPFSAKIIKGCICLYCLSNIYYLYPYCQSIIYIYTIIYKYTYFQYLLGYSSR